MRKVLYNKEVRVALKSSQLCREKFGENKRYRKWLRKAANFAENRFGSNEMNGGKYGT